MHFCANFQEIENGRFFSKMYRSKIFVTQQNFFLRTLEIHYKIFDNSHLKFGRKEKAKIKKQHVRRPVLTTVGFLKSVVSQLFAKYSQSYVNLNIKKKSKIQLPLKRRRGCFSVFYLNVTCRTLQELFRMALVKFVEFVVLKILEARFHAKHFKHK